MSNINKNCTFAAKKNNDMNINISNRNSSKPDGYNFFTQTIIMTLTLMVVGLILPGVHITNVFVAIFAAVVIAMLNNFLRPVLYI